MDCPAIVNNMNPDRGLRTARTVSIGLAGVSLAGVLTVAGLAQHHTTTDNNTNTNTNTGTSTGSTDDTSNSYPTITGDNNGPAAATSGGS